MKKTDKSSYSCCLNVCSWGICSLQEVNLLIFPQLLSLNKSLNKHISILIQSHFDHSFCYLYLIWRGRLSEDILLVDAAVTVSQGILLRLPESWDQYPFFFIWYSVDCIAIIIFGKNNKPRKSKKWKHCSNYSSDILLLNFNNRTKACIYVYMSEWCVCVSDAIAKETREEHRQFVSEMQKRRAAPQLTDRGNTVLHLGAKHGQS